MFPAFKAAMGSEGAINFMGFNFIRPVIKRHVRPGMIEQFAFSCENYLTSENEPFDRET